MGNWLEEYKKELPLWERVLDKIPVIRRLRWIDYYYCDFKFAVKSWWQRRTKGYANSECWNLANSTSEWILPRLKYLRDNFCSVPPNLEVSDTDKYLTSEEWKDRLDKMIYAFEFILKEDEITEKCFPEDFVWGFDLGPADKRNTRELIFKDKRKPDYTYFNECLKKHEEGMKLFVLYFRNLWD